MGLVYPELSLDLKPSFVPDTINGFLKQVSTIGDVAERLDKVDDFVNRLQDELNKIQVFRRELPLCMLLLKDALRVVKQETRDFKTINAYQPVLEEFIPLKRESNKEKNDDEIEEQECGGDKKNWMSSVQLWTSHHLSAPLKQTHPKSLDVSPSKEDEKRSKFGGDDVHDLATNKAAAAAVSKVFVPIIPPAFPELKKVEEEASVPPLSLLAPGMIKHRIDNQDPIPRAFTSKLGGTAHLPNSTPSSTVRPFTAHPSSRKQRRCWSPELHRRFVDALTQLGGAQVATPKQIRELMRVDGLTNDEVKSHLQKYRLHTRRVPNNSIASTNEKSNGAAGSWESQEQYSESGKPTSSQSGSPEGPLQFPGVAGGNSTTAGDSMEDDADDDDRSESYSWKGQVQRSGSVCV